MPFPGPDDTGGTADAPATRAEFETALDELLRATYLNDVEVGYGVDLRHRDDVPDWEVEITALRKPRDR